jgi:hypothetical protein
MGRISTALALGAPLLILDPRLAHAGGALETVTEGASALFGAPLASPKAGVVATTSPLAPLTLPPLAGDARPFPPLTWAPLTAPPPAMTPLAAVVVAAPFESDDTAPRGDELALRVAARVAARIGAGAKAHPLTAQLATARAVAGRASALVYVRSAIVKGDLRATLDVYPSMANAWDRIRNPLPLPTSHAAASAKIDAEIRPFLAPLVLEQATVERARHDEGDVLAAACGDVDGDGDNAVVLVSAARVALGHLRAGRFVAERTAAWSALGPALPVPMREPIAEAVVVRGAVGVGTTDHGGLRLTPALTVDAPLVGLPVWGGDDIVCLRPEASVGAFDGAPVECSFRREPRPKMAVPAPRFDAFGAALVADALGSVRTVVAVREPSGRLRLKTGDTLGATDGTFGAQLAVGDLDQDGAAEIVTSADLTPGGAQSARLDDAIDIATWSPGSPGSASPASPASPGSPVASELRGRFHLAAPGGVRALAMCPSGDHGEPALIAVVGGEVWTIRAGVAAVPIPTAGVVSKAAR